MELSRKLPAGVETAIEPQELQQIDDGVAPVKLSGRFLGQINKNGFHVHRPLKRRVRGNIRWKYFALNRAKDTHTTQRVQRAYRYITLCVTSRYEIEEAHLMTNNDALRSIAYLMHVSDAKLVEIVRMGEGEVGKDEIIAYLKRDDEEGYEPCPHDVMAHFLNGLVTLRRGKKENQLAADIEVPITNNIILKKLRVAFELKDLDIAAIIEKSGLRVSKAELGAFFRRPDHRNYRECGDQFLRNLMKGLTR